MMTGLPGCGKSTVANQLLTQLPACKFIIIASDRVRKTLFPKPNYSATESAQTHAGVRRQILALLAQGHNVIHDATNLRQTDRAWRHTAEQASGCWSLLLHVSLDEQETMRRLAERVAQQSSISDADSTVYFTLKESAEKILQPHFTVRTDANLGNDITAVTNRVSLMQKPEVPAIRKKVFAYITSQSKLQVFIHEHAPEAGVQVPAGSVQNGESLEDAVLREAFEETGLKGLRIVSRLGEQLRDMRDFGRNERHHRTFFHLSYDGPIIANRQHWEHHGADGKHHLFNLFWAPLDNLPYLIADHALFVDKLCQGTK